MTGIFKCAAILSISLFSMPLAASAIAAKKEIDVKPGGANIDASAFSAPYVFCAVVTTTAPGKAPKHFRDGKITSTPDANGVIIHKVAWSQKNRDTGVFTIANDAETLAVKTFRYESKKRFGGTSYDIQINDNKGIYTKNPGGLREQQTEFPLPGPVFSPETREMMFRAVKDPQIGAVYSFPIVTSQPPFHARLEYVFKGFDEKEKADVWQTADAASPMRSTYWITKEAPFLKKFDLVDPKGVVWTHQKCADGATK